MTHEKLLMREMGFRKKRGTGSLPEMGSLHQHMVLAFGAGGRSIEKQQCRMGIAAHPAVYEEKTTVGTWHRP